MYKDDKYKRSRIVISDSRRIMEEEGDEYEKNGYVVAMMDFVNNQGVEYNPFLGFSDNTDIDIYSRTLIENYHKILSGKKSEEYRSCHLINSVFAYLRDYTMQNLHTIDSAIQVMRMADLNKNDTSNKSSLDRLFDVAEREEPKSFAVTQYHDFRDVTSIHFMNETLSECMTIMQSLSPQPKTCYNLETVDAWLNIKNILNEKYAVYIIVSPFDKTSIFKAHMFLWQLNWLSAREKAIYAETELSNRIQTNQLNHDKLSIQPSGFDDEMYEIASEEFGETYPIAWGNMDYISKLYDSEKANIKENRRYNNYFMKPNVYVEKPINMYFDKMFGLDEYKKTVSYDNQNYYSSKYCFDIKKYYYFSGMEYQKMLENKGEEINDATDACNTKYDNTNEPSRVTIRLGENHLENTKNNLHLEDSASNRYCDDADEKIKQIKMELEIEKIKNCLEKLEDAIADK